MREVRLCYTASAGGHIYELQQLDELLGQYPGILITESESVSRHFEAVSK